MGSEPRGITVASPAAEAIPAGVASDHRDLRSYVLRPVMCWRPLWDYVFPA